MIAILLVAAAVTVVALLGLLGRVARSDSYSWAQTLTIGLPLLAISAAPTLVHGFTLISAALAAVSIAVGCLVAVFLGPVYHYTFDGRAVRAGFAWVASGSVVLVLVGLFIAWVSTLVAAYTFLDNAWVAVVIVLAAGAMAYGKGAFRGTALAVAIISIGFTVLLLLGGFFAGSIDSLSDPVIYYESTPIAEAVFYSLAVAIVGATNLGWRSVGGVNRSALLVGGLVLAAIVFLGSFGLLMLLGGAIQVPSVPLETLVAYTPPAVSALLAGVFALVGAVVAGQAIAMVIDRGQPLAPSIFPLNKPRIDRLIGVLILASVVVVVAVVSPSPTWMVPLFAIIGLIGLFIEFEGRRRGSETDSEDIGEPATGTST